MPCLLLLAARIAVGKLDRTRPAFMHVPCIHACPPYLAHTARESFCIVRLVGLKIKSYLRAAEIKVVTQQSCPLNRAAH